MYHVGDRADWDDRVAAILPVAGTLAALVILLALAIW